MKQYYSSKLIRVMVLAAILFSILSVAPSRVMGQIGVITYKEGRVQPQRIYAFITGTNGKLYVNYWDGSKWRWADQGKPPRTNTAGIPPWLSSSVEVSGTPGVITYRVGTEPQRIYAFVKGNDGNLYVRHRVGSKWYWADQGWPPGTAVSPTSSPSVLTYPGGTSQRIDAFVLGIHPRLYVNHWNGSQWQWAEQGKPLGTTLTDSPSVITYREGTTQWIHAFIKGFNGKLYVNYWNGSKWRWADQGKP